MSNQTSVLAELLQALPEDWRSQMYFKSSLTALSHAMEDQVLAGSDRPLVIASFQRERFYRQEAHRYRRIAQKTNQVYVLAAPETDFTNRSDVYETVAFGPKDLLAQEWHLVVIGEQHTSCLVCRERTASVKDKANTNVDNNRRFEGIWTSDREVSEKAAKILLDRILYYRPELKEKIAKARDRYFYTFRVLEKNPQHGISCPINNPDPFVQRLVTYLQAGQYKLLKANRSLMEKEERERLVNSITSAIRRSLDPKEILQVAVEKLGKGLGACRCIVYRCKDTDVTATIEHQYIKEGIKSAKGQTWPLQNNCLFREVATRGEAASIENTLNAPLLKEGGEKSKVLLSLVEKYSILSWLLVPILYQDKLLGMMELHYCQANPSAWKPEDISLLDAIATQVGVALMQAEAYANLEDLNQQLEALDRTRSNLVAITGHELRTPLSTIQVCLESLTNEPDMSAELRQVMLNTALTDAERMRKLIQDFLTLSQLESGRIQWHPEPLSLAECVELALSNVRARNAKTNLPKISNLVSPELPLVRADGEWLVEVLAKLLDNACKFTSFEGQVTIEVNQNNSVNLAVTIADTGRGIEPNRLETVFDRFYQEEGALRRSVGGTGLGLAICRQIVNGWGGEIWAESAGKNHGSQFHFTVPIVSEPPAAPSSATNGHSRMSAVPKTKRQSSLNKKRKNST